MDKVVPFLLRHGYPVLFFWVLAETMGLPIPSAPMLITVGALAGTGQMNVFISISLGMFAAFLGDIFWYFMGRRHGGKVLSLICRISVEPDSCVRRTENVFARFGARSLLVTKFFPGLGAVATPLAGITGMRPPRFVLFDGVGILLWAGAYVLFGYLFSEELDRALVYALGMGRSLLVLIAGALSFYILLKYFKRRRFLHQLSIARITPEELKQKLDAGEDIMIIDVRHSIDFESDPSVIPGALRIPLEQFEGHQDIPRDREVVLYCT